MRQYPGVIDVHMEQHSDGNVTGVVFVGDTPIALDSITSVYARLPDTTGLHRYSNRDDETQIMANAAYDASLNILLDRLPCLVVNRPSAQLSNSSKPYQQQLIAAAGFATPRSLITSDPHAARLFYDQCDGRVIYKSISSVRSIVRRLTPTAFDRLVRLPFAPVQFQEYIAGDDIRVHVVGSDVFATRIVSEADDYRYARNNGGGVSLTATTMPPKIGEDCIALAEMLQLPFAGIDLRHHPDGTYYCFEVNPSPAFTFYEAHTEQPISAALVSLLQHPVPAYTSPRLSRRPLPLLYATHCTIASVQTLDQSQVPEPFIVRCERPLLSSDLSGNPPPQSDASGLHQYLADDIAAVTNGNRDHIIEPVFRRLGPVNTHPNIISLYWGEGWSAKANMRMALDAALTSVIHSAYIDGLREYAVGTDVRYEGVIIATMLPRDTAALQARLTRMVENLGEPQSEFVLCLVIGDSVMDVLPYGVLELPDGRWITWAATSAQSLDDLTVWATRSIVDGLTDPQQMNGHVGEHCIGQPPARFSGVAVAPYWSEVAKQCVTR
ncbi:MAG: hypothetical protein H0X37_16315 [Herpetosiphonaceae bacterium]|nr:hypothetical protein [Herpetosiphonaceae bacterium]